MEIERKFLVRSAPDGLDERPAQRIDQGYLAIGDDGEEVRLRRIGDALLLTVKRGTGEVRTEEEIELERAQFERLWPLTEGRRIEKTRYRIPHGDLVIELDVYEGRLEGLMTAEVEFPAEGASADFEPPGWLGDDVTEDARYRNEQLARNGLAGLPGAHHGQPRGR
jgi:adenylate cyclase